MQTRVHPDSGPKASVLCLHASASSARQWTSLAIELGPDWHLVAPDLPGYGADRTWTTGRPARLASELAAIERRLPLLPRRLHLVGHSYGGALALELARRHPQRFASLALYEPVLFSLLRAAPDRADSWRRIRALAATLEAELGRGDAGAAAARFVDYWNGQGCWSGLAPARRAALAARMPKVAAEFAALVAAPRRASDFAGLQMPVLLMAGTASPAPVADIVSLLRRELPLPALRSLPGLGHMAPLDQAPRVNREIRRFLRRHDAGPARPATLLAPASAA